MQTQVQVTVVEYVAEFFRQYKSRAYGKSINANAKGGAEALMGMLKLVLSKGGRDELRSALHCFKDQLNAAMLSGPARNIQLEELFSLLSSLIDSAERVRQFSPVKESFSTAVLEEVRWRLFRIIAGDGFSEDVGVRRRALDIIFQALQREQQEQQKSLARQQQLAAASNAGGRSVGSDLNNLSPVKARLRLHRKAPGSLGPDVSSWEGLWASLTAMTGKKMLPLLQSVMKDLYSGKPIPGSPAAAAAAAVSSNKAYSTPHKQQQQHPAPQVSSSDQPLPAAAAVLQPAPSRRDTAGSIDVASDAAVAAAARSGSEVLLSLDAADAAAGAGNTNSGDISSACGVDTPPRQHSDDTHEHARQSASSAAMNKQQQLQQQVQASDVRVQQQQQQPIRVSCASSNGNSPVAASEGNHPESPISTSSGCLGSPTAPAAKQKGPSFVAKLRASVGGSSSGAGSSGPPGWIPKGWVQFQHKDKSSSGVCAAADSGNTNGVKDTSLDPQAVPLEGLRVLNQSRFESKSQGSVGEYSGSEFGGTDTPSAAGAAAFGGEDVDWSSCSSPAGSSIVAAPTALKV